MLTVKYNEYGKAISSALNSSAFSHIGSDKEL